MIRLNVRAFLAGLSLSTVQARYLNCAIGVNEPSREREVQRILDGTPSTHLVLLAVDGSDIRGVAEFVVESADRADVGFLVEDAFQGQGIGRSLFAKLANHALHRGIRVFSGDVAQTNSRMLAMLRRMGRRVQFELSYDTVRFCLSLTDELSPLIQTRAATRWTSRQRAGSRRIYSG